MREAVIQYLPWFLSACTVYTMFLAGNKNRMAWTVALVSQVAWAVWIAFSEAWGLVPGHVALWVVYARNWWKWGEEQNKSET